MENILEFEWDARSAEPLWRNAGTRSCVAIVLFRTCFVTTSTIALSSREHSHPKDVYRPRCQPGWL